jgi:prephenate dehydrogenase
MGQMGGSLGMALVKRRLAARVVGIDRDARARRRAVARRACHETSGRIDAAAGADLVVLAVPVRSIVALAKRVPRGGLITDVGSTKVQVARVFARIPGAVPGHPMCGTERSGLEAADPDMFLGAAWVLTRRSPKLERLVRALGARPVLMSPAAHDRAAARASHLPYALALALITLAGRRPPLAAGSFRSATRVAAQPRAMGLDILLTNRFPLARETATMARLMKRLSLMLRRGDAAALDRFVRAGSR